MGRVTKAYGASGKAWRVWNEEAIVSSGRRDSAVAASRGVMWRRVVMVPCTGCDGTLVREG